MRGTQVLRDGRDIDADGCTRPLYRMQAEPVCFVEIVLQPLPDIVQPVAAPPIRLRTGSFLPHSRTVVAYGQLQSPAADAAFYENQPFRFFFPIHRE